MQWERPEPDGFEQAAEDVVESAGGARAEDDDEAYTPSLIQARVLLRWQRNMKTSYEAIDTPTLRADQAALEDDFYAFMPDDMDDGEAADGADCADCVASCSDVSYWRATLLRRCDCSPAAGSMREALRSAMLSNTSSRCSTVLILANTLLMCMPYAGMSAAYAERLEALGDRVTDAFILEFCLKLVSMGCAAYWADGWNQLDGTVVCLSLFERLATRLLTDTDVDASALRTLRLLRLLRMLKAWPGLFHVVMSFVRAISQISNLFVLMFLFMFIFALIGMQASTRIITRIIREPLGCQYLQCHRSAT